VTLSTRSFLASLSGARCPLVAVQHPAPFLRLSDLPRWYRRICPCRRQRGSPPSPAIARNGAFLPFLDIGVASKFVLATCRGSPTNNTRPRLHSLAHRPLIQRQLLLEQAGGPATAGKPLRCCLLCSTYATLLSTPIHVRL
jgi:hypothetical protein